MILEWHDIVIWFVILIVGFLGGWLKRGEIETDNSKNLKRIADYYHPKGK